MNSKVAICRNGYLRDLTKQALGAIQKRQVSLTALRVYGRNDVTQLSEEHEVAFSTRGVIDTRVPGNRTLAEMTQIIHRLINVILEWSQTPLGLQV